MNNVREEWKPVVGYEDFYECSNLGRFRSLPKVVNGRWGKCRYKGKVIKVMESLITGYGLICLVKENRKKTTIRSHRLIAKAFIPNPDGKLYVNHIDLNKMNNRVDNLEWVTAKENTAHARASKEWNVLRGENAPTAKIKEHQVIEIRKLFASGMKQHEIQKHLTLTKGIVFNVITGRTWKHVL